MKLSVEFIKANTDCMEYKIDELANGRTLIDHTILTKLGLSPPIILEVIEKIKLGGNLRFHLYADIVNRVLHAFEKQYPENKHPRKTIQGVRDYADDKITIEELKKIRADTDAGNFDCRRH